MVDSFPHEPEELATPPESKDVKHNRRARLRQELKPIIVLVNNDGYTIERFILALKTFGSSL